MNNSIHGQAIIHKLYTVCTRTIHETAHVFRKPSANLKGKKITAQKWLERQQRDPYVKQARLDNWRCRSAFKLIEIDDKYKLLKPGFVVVDCGAAPGSWTEVSVERVNALSKDPTKLTGKVIGIDLLPIVPIPGATLLGESNFTTSETQNRIMEYLEGRKAQAVITDMAPNATGVREMDHQLIIELGLSALKFATSVLGNGGSFVCKLWQGSEQKKLETFLEKFFKDVNLFKPHASRLDSSEIFIVARKYKGPYKEKT